MYVNSGPFEAYGLAKRYTFGKEPLLFLDDSFLQIARGVERVWYLPEKRPQPVMKATEPWESFGRFHCVGGFSGRSIININNEHLGMFYSIYHMHDTDNEFRSFAYAVSHDGETWEKPVLSDGKTNLLHVNARGVNGPKMPYYEMQNVMWDEHSQQFICMGHCMITSKQVGTFYGTSKYADKWNPKNFHLAYRNEDIHSLLGWDEEKACYISYPRVLVYKAGRKTRAIGCSASYDLKTWTEPIKCFEANPFDPFKEIYNMPVVKRGPYYIAFPIIFDFRYKGFGPLETAITVSVDGVNFSSAKTPLAMFLPRGRAGEWDDCYTMTASPVEWKDETRFYYWGCNFPHDEGFREEKESWGSVGLATLKRDRYCSLSCPTQGGGQVMTGFLKGKGKIFLNADASRGSIAIKIFADNKQIGEGNIMIGTDELDYNTGMEVPSCNFQLQFIIRDAELFGVRLGE